MISPKEINDLSERIKTKTNRTIKSRYDIRYGMVPIEFIFNPNPPDKTTRFSELRQDFENLLVSVGSEGLRNPLIGKSQEDGTVRITVGYSRAWAAKITGVTEVPCFVNDHWKHFGHLELIQNIDHARTKFTDQPYTVKIMLSGITSSEPLVTGKSWWSDENKKLFHNQDKIAERIRMVKERLDQYERDEANQS